MITVKATLLTPRDTKLVPQTANISDNDLKSNDIKEKNGSAKESG
jgi:hypothetical protein